MTQSQLTKRRYELAMELGQFELELERRKQQKKSHIPASEIVGEKAKDILPTSIEATFAMLIAPELGFDTATMEAFLANVPPKFAIGLSHSHGDAIKYYLSGRAIELVGDKEVSCGAWGRYLHPRQHLARDTKPLRRTCSLLRRRPTGREPRTEGRPLLKQVRVLSHRPT